MENEKELIVLVDDNPSNLRAGKNVLTEHYSVATVPSAKKMFSLLENNTPALILLDVDMPEMNGYETIKILKENPETKDIPVIFLTGKTDTENEIEGLDLGAIDYIVKPFMPSLLLKRIEVHLLVERQKKTLEVQQKELKNFNDNLQRMVDEKTETVLGLQEAMLKTVVDLVESRDDITGGHIERTQHGVRVLVEALLDHPVFGEEVSRWDIKLLLQSSQLHDVGKIAISDRILLKPGKLDRDEFEEMKQHTTIGVQIIERIESITRTCDFLRYAKIFAGTHHEKWDGSGYPEGLSDKSIPLQGRIMALADVYDALVSERPYKKAFSRSEAIKIIQNAKGIQFDPILTDIFAKVMET
ncbi:MAG: response regulator [Planctomycetaceae bacterium]|jgi:putative two-component system response regulator|nr:response regulator [Planctomycetaceae bacterium]